MKTLEAKPFDQHAENWKRENRLLTSTVLAAGAPEQNRIGTHALRNHQTVWFFLAAQTPVSSHKLALLVTKGFSSPIETPKPRKHCEGRFSTSLTGMKSCTVNHRCTLALKHATKLAVFFRFFESFLWHFNEKQRGEVIFIHSRPVSFKNPESGAGKQWSLHAPLNSSLTCASTARFDLEVTMFEVGYINEDTVDCPWFVA